MKLEIAVLPVISLAISGFLHWKSYQMIKNLKVFTTKNFVDCLDLIAEVYVSQFWHPQLKPVLLFYTASNLQTHLS